MPGDRQPSAAPPRSGIDEGGQSFGQRAGFWIGLALFASLMASPTPDSMKLAVRRHFASQVIEEVARALKRAGHADAPTDSEARREAEDRAVADRARVMLAAAAVTALVACWWITVAVPIPVTSLLPLLLFPLVGVLPIQRAAMPYANKAIFLFMGGFIIALAIERWKLHRRIALHVVRIVGGNRRTIVLGFMLASAALSMWISNTATTLMMLPIGMAIVSSVAALARGDDRGEHANFSAALMLGIAYAASIGGVATPIGTPPNIAFQGQFAELFPDAPQIGFGQWLLAHVPLVAVFLPVVWLVLVRVTCRVSKAPLPVGREVIAKDLNRLGPLRGPERAVSIIFVMTAILWVTRSIPVGDEDYGWSAYLHQWLSAEGWQHYPFRADYIHDATVALAMAVLLFVIPAGRDRDGRRRFLMDWQTARRLPWGILLLFGGGFAIAAAFRDSGLSYWCGLVFSNVGITNPILLVVATCLLMTFLTEITSNTATTQVMLPILARVAATIGVHPLLLMLPATVSASCAFMLPVATPPNAIVFGSGCITMSRMVRSGIIINLIGVVLVTAAFYLFVKPLLGIDLTTLPRWAG